MARLYIQDFPPLRDAKGVPIIFKTEYHLNLSGYQEPGERLAP